MNKISITISCIISNILISNGKNIYFRPIPIELNGINFSTHYTNYIDLSSIDNSILYGTYNTNTSPIPLLSFPSNRADRITTRKKATVNFYNGIISITDSSLDIPFSTNEKKELNIFWNTLEKEVGNPYKIALKNLNYNTILNYKQYNNYGHITEINPETLEAFFAKPSESYKLKNTIKNTSLTLLNSNPLNINYNPFSKFNFLSTFFPHFREDDPHPKIKLIDWMDKDHLLFTGTIDNTHSGSFKCIFNVRNGSVKGYTTLKNTLKGLQLLPNNITPAFEELHQLPCNDGTLRWIFNLNNKKASAEWNIQNNDLNIVNEAIPYTFEDFLKLGSNTFTDSIRNQLYIWNNNRFFEVAGDYCNIEIDNDNNYIIGNGHLIFKQSLIEDGSFLTHNIISLQHDSQKQQHTLRINGRLNLIPDGPIGSASCNDRLTTGILPNHTKDIFNYKYNKKQVPQLDQQNFEKISFLNEPLVSFKKPELLEETEHIKYQAKFKELYVSKDDSVIAGLAVSADQEEQFLGIKLNTSNKKEEYFYLEKQGNFKGITPNGKFVFGYQLAVDNNINTIKGVLINTDHLNSNKPIEYALPENCTSVEAATNDGTLIIAAIKNENSSNTLYLCELKNEVYDIIQKIDNIEFEDFEITLTNHCYIHPLGTFFAINANDEKVIVYKKEIGTWKNISIDQVEDYSVYECAGFNEIMILFNIKKGNIKKRVALPLWMLNL